MRGLFARRCLALVVVVVALGVSALLAVSAEASLTHPFTGSFGPEGPFSASTFADVQGVAVDASTGDVYVYDTGSGSVYKFNAAGEPMSFSELGSNVITGVGGDSFAENEIAVDSSTGPAKGDIYIANGHHIGIYGPGGKPIEIAGKVDELNGEVGTEVPGAPWGEPCGVAVDSEGNVYVGLATGKNSYLNKYTPAGSGAVNADYVSSLWELPGELCNVGVDPEGNIYADTYPAGPITKYEASQLKTEAQFKADGSEPSTGTPVGSGGSTLNADPSPSSHILYLDQLNRVAEYDTSAAAAKLLGTFGGIEPGAIGGSYGVAGNAAGDVYVADGGTVEMFGQPEVLLAQIDSEYATGVTSSSANINAQINPEGADTTYSIQYGLEDCGEHPSSCTTVPSPEGDVGSGESDQSAGAYLQGLAEDSTYHYRVVVHNTNGTVRGVDHTFTTQSASTGFSLPEGRQYEMVSPPNKDGAETGSFNVPESGLEASSEDGSELTYVESGPIGENPPGNEQAAQVLAKRTSNGWSSQDITTPHDVASSVGVGHGQEYRLFSPDLAVALIEPYGTTTLSPKAPADERNLYLRNQGDGSYEPLVTTQPPEAFSASGDELRVAGSSKDLSHVVFTSRQALVSPAVEVAGENLYMWIAGKLQLVNVLPDNKPTTFSASLGDVASKDTRNTVFDNGRVIWTDDQTDSIYMRDTVGGRTVQVGQGEYQTASDDGSRIFSIDGNGILSEFDAGTEKLATIGSAVQGVLGASEDGTSVYFVANDRLYVSHLEGTSWAPPTLIATLDASDSPSWRGSSSSGEDLADLTSRVSPNGRYVAFMSSASLTGYDNRDAVSGKPDVEVYVYDSASTGHLACASCNPTGARPIGELDSSAGLPLPIDQSKAWDGQWLAASIPGWDITDGEQGLYQPRYLSNSGRLFFDSVDGLVPHDTNGKQDVYEYVPLEVGGCQEPGGCVSLISAGTGSADSSFVDASVSGDDVFFLTRDRLLSQDYDNSYDIYDAHLCSASAPCIPDAVVPPPPCTTGDACRAAPTPQPAIFGAPASATFSDSASLAQSTAVNLVKPKSGKAKKGKAKKGKAKKGKAKKGKAKKRSAKRDKAKGKRKAAGRKGKRAKRSSAGGLTLTDGAKQ
jgi:hypothetical protein